MSAICGFINLDSTNASPEIGTSMMEKLRIYRADSSETWSVRQAFLGCHHQVVTPESKFERLPFEDLTVGLTITADAIIDNRVELLKIFGITQLEWKKVTDSQLILLAYKKWDTKCPVYLVGDYAFAIWNKNKNELFCARDHVGKRTFYYTYQANMFAFCTVMKPLLVIPSVEKTLNDQWLADFLAIHTVAHELDSNHTVYKNIEQLAPAHSMVVNINGLTKQKYWDPLELPKTHYKTVAEYDAAFREIFLEAVRCRTRSVGTVGIMLSGGLDSGSVACVASAQLKEQSKRLHAYSSIPMDGYKEWLPPSHISDERDYIESVRGHCGNIDVTYCRTEGRHSVSDVDKFLTLLEQPYKIVENLFWLDNINEIASKNGCSVLLDGQFGNSTISYGNFQTHIFSLLSRGSLITLYNEITSYCRLHGFSRKLYGRKIFKQFANPIIQRFMNNEKFINYTNKNGFKLINPELELRYNTNSRLLKAGYNLNTSRNFTLTEMRKHTMNSPAFSHIGAIETKLSLTYGIAKRDPTRDKRIIEFCFTIPGDLYVKDGQERLLVRRAMEGILPDKVRLNTRQRGKQSADWLQRLSPSWSELQLEIAEKLQNVRLQQYVDVEQVGHAIKRTQDLVAGKTNQVDVRMLLTVLIMERFLKLE